jgi:hypothetical protein
VAECAGGDGFFAPKVNPLACLFCYALVVNTLRSDPFLIVAFTILTAVFCVGVLASWLLHRLSEYLDNRTPAFRRPLEAAYARFHGFLLAVRLAALRSRS